jgi:hypothetical protein
MISRQTQMLGILFSPATINTTSSSRQPPIITIIVPSPLTRFADSLQAILVIAGL